MTAEQSTLSIAIAQALGDGWQVDESRNGHPYFTRASDSLSFYLRFGGYGNESRIYVGPNWPKDRDGREVQPYFSSFSGTKSPSITVADSKPAARIAKDIAKRFLPDFEPLWAAQQTLVANANRAEDLEAANMVRFAEAVDARIWRDAHDRKRKGITMPDTDGYRISSKVDSHGVDLELRGLSVDEAIYITNWLRGQREEATK